jgi:hypothetical protein
MSSTIEVTVGEVATQSIEQNNRTEHRIHEPYQSIRNSAAEQLEGYNEFTSVYSRTVLK